MKFLFFIFLFSYSYESIAKPYNRIVVFSGGGFEFVQFLGMMEALEESGKKPDLIIATCGGSLAAMMVANIPDAKSRRDFILSKDFRSFFREARPTDKIGSLWTMYSWYQGRKKEAANKLIPDIFREYLVSLPNSLSVFKFSEGFATSSIPIVIIGGKVLFEPEHVGQDIKAKLYREIFFTTPNVATYLEGRKSVIAHLAPESSIESNISVVTDFKISEAARAAIASPFLLPPTLIRGEYFVGGSIDLYPLELARSLGDEVLMSFGEGYDDSGSGKLVKATYQYNVNERLQLVHDLESTWWVDFSDREQALKKKDGLGVNASGFSISFQMPKDDEPFNRHIMAHYDYGKARTLEALNQKASNEKCHIRDMNTQNSSEALRKLCRRVF
ncbi:MAG: hypothetical protein A4S09_16630 [Proteobacteria bacterium SG_bin7]|nr:MAG: hypothetical protein A4S09_16630 [Proteobacteria bacterium SG_bin7]